MNEMEEKLSAILGNPQMMQQVMSMAQALGASSSQAPPDDPASESPDFDPGLLKSLAGIAKGSTMDSNQQSLLKALCPYMSEHRVHKLEKAMKAARLASMASGFLNAGGLQMLTGR